ncbi:substrate-binding domain-containing protein [Nesterenkonia sp. AY15]|uniref:molybdate ABC transporter substrate-binding protein n=1 Tax=Nesterenkonia sp. AY15 TaxID=2901139 RepID=UPI001F4C8D2C|nr:substrate-binding domain-containing protein [Nesterenkonia sp. AY15]MCH8571678.1 substrate-binding domain-containing protein [Nesterenkonia sp. AY15]
MKPDSLFFRLRGVIALVLLLCFVAAFVLSACGPATGVSAGENRSVTVLAAPSTAPALDALRSDLHDRQSGVSAQVEYLGSDALERTIESGHDADLVLTASRDQMLALTQDGSIEGDPIPLASNRLVLVATAENPFEILDFDDFAARAADLRVSTCAGDAPCTEQITDLSGAFDLDLTDEEFHMTRAGFSAEPDSALQNLTEGSSDAALAYVTDVLAQDVPLQTFEIPQFQQSTTQVWAGVLTDPENSGAANEFFGILAGERARSAFSEAGFLPAPVAEAEASSDQ